MLRALDSQGKNKRIAHLPFQYFQHCSDTLLEPGKILAMLGTMYVTPCPQAFLSTLNQCVLFKPGKHVCYEWTALLTAFILLVEHVSQLNRKTEHGTHE